MTPLEAIKKCLVRPLLPFMAHFLECSKVMVVCRKILLGILVCFGLVGCSPDYSITLSDGYFVSKVSGNSYVIAEENGTILIGPSYFELDVIKKTVVGCEKNKWDEDGCKFFVLNMETKDLQTQLTYNEWINQISKMGIDTNRIELRKPTRIGTNWIDEG